MKNVKNKIKNYFNNYCASIKSIPGILLGIYLVTLVVMNVLANKTIYQSEYLALDGGIVVTWIAAIIADVVTVLKGPKVTIRMTLLGIVVTLISSLLFYLVSLIPAGEEFKPFSQVLGGTWFIIISSAIAFICSSSLDALINYFIGTKFKKDNDSKMAFMIRATTSSLISTIFDNLLFNMLAFMAFAPIFWNGFHWTFTQCLCCALTYGAIEVLIDLIIMPVAYKVYCHYKKENN